MLGLVFVITCTVLYAVNWDIFWDVGTIMMSDV